MYVQKYIEKLDEKIEKIVRNEADGLTDAERDLHILFENRKHAKKWKEDMQGMMENPGIGMRHDSAMPTTAAKSAY